MKIQREELATARVDPLWWIEWWNMRDGDSFLLFAKQAPRKSPLVGVLASANMMYQRTRDQIKKGEIN